MVVMLAFLMVYSTEVAKIVEVGMLTLLMMYSTTHKDPLILIQVTMLTLLMMYSTIRMFLSKGVWNER
jgi:hypothetical protein